MASLLLFSACLHTALSHELRSLAHRNETMFAQYKREYGVVYASPAEEASRYLTFVRTLSTIAEMNAEPTDHAVYGVTKWADRTPKELREKAGKRHRPSAASSTMTGIAGSHAWDGTCYAGKRPEFAHVCNATLPDSWDWSEHGAVTPIKDQGKCGNCFAFGATGDFEAAWFLAGNDLVSLSEQQITSCDRNGDDGGCSGGGTNLDTDQYAMVAGGIVSEADYPDCSSTYSCAGNTKHEKHNGVCNHADAKKVTKISGGYQISGGVKDCHWCDKQSEDEERMKKHLVQAGPMTIAINSKHFDNYKKGIMSPPAENCKANINSLDHQVLIVGYGTDTQSGLDYWKIKNSWSKKWGEDGYCRVVRNKNNRCGVASDATHAIAGEM